MATPNLIYLFNEASSGTTPTNVLDSSSGTALNLAITYGTSSWTSIGAGRGLNFGGACGAVSAALNGTKVATAMAGATQATIEVVADTTSYTGFNQLMGLSATGANGIFVLVTGSSGANQVGIGGAGSSAWFDVTPGLHHFLAVYDSTQATAANRLRLYVDGALASVNATPFAPTYPALNTAIDVGFTDYANNQITVGCLTSANTEPYIGPIYFAALYASALTSGDATAHSTSLLANNDADPNGAAATFVPFRRQAPQVTPDDPPPPPRRRLLVPSSPAASSFVPFRRQPPPRPDEQQFIFMGLRSATIQSGPVAPDSPPLGWPRRVLSLFRQADEDPPRQQRRFAPIANPAVVPDNPPWGWPRRLAMLSARAVEEVLPVSPRPSRVTASGPVPPAPPPAPGSIYDWNADDAAIIGQMFRGGGFPFQIPKVG